MSPAPDADAAVAAALNHPSRLLLCDRNLLADLAAAVRSGRTVVDGARWVLLDLSPLSEEQSTAAGPSIERPSSRPHSDHRTGQAAVG